MQLSLPFALLVASAPVFAQGGMGFQTLVMDAADADRDGAVSASEWRAWLGALPAGPRDTLDADAIKVEILVRRLDADADGALSAEDLQAAFVAIDADGSGTLESSETDFDRGPARAAARQGGFADFLARGVLAPAADADGDGVVSGAEWTAFLGGLAGAPIGDAVVRGWIRAAEQAPGGRSAFTPGVFLLTLNSNLDVDRNGRLTRSDLEATFAALDTNGDGDVDAAERAAPPAVDPRSAPRGEDAGTAGPVPLMPWQRNLEDALALVRRTGKPLLVCVNMDGEPASESLAARRYRDPAFVALAEGFIPVLASPDRHDPSGRDDRGRRLADTKFGRVIDQEHIDIEPGLFERFFDGRRVAPRHVGVSPRGEILFDLYLLNDLSVIDTTLREHGQVGAALAEPQTEAELLDSPDAGHRDRLEALFVSGDEAARARLASLALSDVRATQHPELLWLALHDPLGSVRVEGIWTLVRHPKSAPLELVPRAFRIAKDPRLYDALLRSVQFTATNRFDPRRARATHLARVFEGLRTAPAGIEAERWRLAVMGASASQESPLTASDESRVTENMAAIDERLDDDPDDPELNLLLAAATMRLARIHLQDGRNPTFFLEDVRAAARRATSAERPSGAALGYLAWADWLLGDLEAAGEHAAAALPHLFSDAVSPLAAEVLNIHAQTGTRALYAAMSEEAQPWTAQEVAEILAAYEILLEHPAGTERHATEFLDFLSVIEAYAAEGRVVRRALERFPLALELHARLRAQSQRDDGAMGLEMAYGPHLEYGRMHVDPAHEATFDWFQGLAAFLAAEHRVSNRESDRALVPYDWAIGWFEASIEKSPSFESSAMHYVCLAHAGRARLFTATGEWDEAEREALDALDNENVRDVPDGLGKTAVQSARELLRALRDAGETDRMSSLAERMAELGVSATAGDER